MNNFERMNERRENARIMGEFLRGLAALTVGVAIVVLIIFAIDSVWGV